MWRQYDPSTAGLISGTDVCFPIHIQLLSFGKSLQKSHAWIFVFVVQKWDVNNPGFPDDHCGRLNIEH